MLRKGFTLIELLVVITILAVLAGAALPYVQAYVEESRIAKTRADLEEIARALAVFEMREGAYTKDSVADLTGRYLNKAPIDPWGKPYKINIDSGLVISGGPDRDYETSEDNVQAPYQPPLALVSAKWVDRNQSGAVDTNNSSDTIQLTFSRKLDVKADGTNTGGLNLVDNVDEYFVIDGSSKIFSELFKPSSLKVVASKTLVYNVLVDDAFTPGSDRVVIISSHTHIIDMDGHQCIGSQPVRILPQ